MVLFHRLPELMQDLLLVADGAEDVLHLAERDTLGFGHADVGGHLLRLWNLPESLSDAVARHHHTPIDAEERLEVLIVQGADVLSNRSEIGALLDEPHSESPKARELWTALRIGNEDSALEDIMGNAVLKFTDTVAMFVN